MASARPCSTGHDPIVGIVEHDAYILTFLYTCATRPDGWTLALWWMLLCRHAGQQPHHRRRPGLYVAANICEREENRKVSLREFLRWSVPSRSSPA